MNDVAASSLFDHSVGDLVQATAAKTPTPGGGSIAGVVGALATALGEMTLNFTRGKKKYVEHEQTHRQIAGRLERARKMFQTLADEDVQAYNLYRSARELDDGPEKEEASALATAAAIDVPRETAKLALAVLGELHRLAPISNRYLVSDLLASAVLCAAVTRLCDFNVRVNVPQLPDRQAAEDLLKASAKDVGSASKMVENVEEIVSKYLP